MNACRRMLVLTSAVLCLGATWATDGVWSNLTTGLWSDPANWRNGSVGGGAGASVVIAPGFGGERPENRMMEIPDAGVTLGSLVYEAGDPMGAIRIWGGPLTFDGNGGEARIRGCVDPATGGVRANAFARNRGLGGQRLAEVVIYNEPLLDEDAESAKNYLFAKWWGNGAARVYDELSVAAGATLDCSGANVVAATLACAGTIRADRLAVGTLALESDGTGVTSFVLEGNFDGTTLGIAFVDGVELPRNGSAVYRVANVAGCLGMRVCVAGRSSARPCRRAGRDACSFRMVNCCCS